MSPEILECCRIWTRQRADRPACKQHLSTRRAAGQDTRVTSWSRRQRKFITWFVLLTFRKKLWLRPMYWRLPFLSFFSSHLSLLLFTFILLCSIISFPPSSHFSFLPFLFRLASSLFSFSFTSFTRTMSIPQTFSFLSLYLLFVTLYLVIYPSLSFLSPLPSPITFLRSTLYLPCPQTRSFHAIHVATFSLCSIPRVLRYMRFHFVFFHRLLSFLFPFSSFICPDFP